jgi:hypothetical protein
MTGFSLMRLSSKGKPLWIQNYKLSVKEATPNAVWFAGNDNKNIFFSSDKGILYKCRENN